MNGAFEHLIAPIYRYEGTLARLMGDAIFAFFGAPIAHEDDPQRAVSAGLDIIDGIQAYRERQRADRGLDLNVRVGINTGPVVVGQVGSDLRLEYTAMGDAVNVAARMEQTAEPGTVQITAETYRRIASSFDAEPRGGVEVKGKTEPVVAYRVVGRKQQPETPSRTHATPLVGREHEMEILTRAIADVHEGRGRIVSLIAEAGLGKSRLIEETQQEWGGLRPDDDPPQHLGRPADLGDVAVRFLRHDTALRAVSPDAGPDRRDRRHRPAGRRSGEVGTDHRLLRGVGGTSHARLARTVRCAGTRRRAARGGGVQGRDHGTGPGIDPPRGHRTSAAGVRGPPLVRRGVDGRADRDGQARRRAPVPVPVRVPPRSGRALLAAQAMARDRVPGPLDRDRALAPVGAGQRRSGRCAPACGRGTPRPDPRTDRGQPAVRGGGRDGGPAAGGGVRRGRSRSPTRCRR